MKDPLTKGCENCKSLRNRLQSIAYFKQKRLNFKKKYVIDKTV